MRATEDENGDGNLKTQRLHSQYEGAQQHRGNFDLHPFFPFLETEAWKKRERAELLVRGVGR